MCAAITADRGFTWSDEETTLLLQLWGANDAQSELTGNKRNFPVYEKISESMTSMGYMRTASQCREKIKRMKREYSLTKQHHDKRTGPKKNMRFFEQFHKILLEKQSRTQRNAALKASSSANIESGNGEISITNKRTWDNIERKINTRSRTSNLAQKRNENAEKDEENPWTPDILLVEGEESPEALFDSPCSPSSKSADGDITENRKKKCKMSSEIPYLKCMMDTLTLKLMKYQTESDARILTKIEELENERTAMDERIQKMWMDFEEKRRSEEREHELNIMKIFQDIMNQMKVNNVPKE